MPVSAAEYEALLKREMDRFNRGGATEGPRRDQAVRSANIAAGYGNSTALQQRQAQAAGEPSPETTAAVPAPRPTIESLFVPPEFPQYFGEQPQPPLPPRQFPQYFGEQPTQPTFVPPFTPPFTDVPPDLVPPAPEESPPRRTRFPVDLRALFR